MAPERFRKGWGFAGLGASVITLLAATPALAQQAFSANMLAGAMPLTVALGAGGFALLAMALVRRLLRDAKSARTRANQQIATLRARVDEYEALLSGTGEVTVLWTENTEGPKFLGQTSIILPPGRRPEAVMDFNLWLRDAEAVGRAVRAAHGTAAAMATATDASVEAGLRAMARLLRETTDVVLKANAEDTRAAAEAGMSGGLLDRLRLTDDL